MDERTRMIVETAAALATGWNPGWEEHAVQYAATQVEKALQENNLEGLHTLAMTRVNE